jgi:NAD-dependent dihydropyrimidine dehydrogenase PreA subunit
LRYFRKEYEAHIDHKSCPAGVCRELIRYEVDPKVCKGCGACLKACPHKAIRGKTKKPHAIDQAVCARCGICKDVCKFDAIGLC